MKCFDFTLQDILQMCCKIDGMYQITDRMNTLSFCEMLQFLISFIIQPYHDHLPMGMRCTMLSLPQLTPLNVLIGL